MDPPYPSPTPTWRNDTYASIDPTKPELSQAGKTVIITGAGSGIGRETAISFAKAGAKHLILIGRTESTLLETQKLISGSTTSTVYPCSITDEEGVEKIAREVGAWDVLILSAAHIATPAALIQTPLDDWWKGYETNVKSIVIFSKAFFPNANANASVYAITAGALVLPAKITAGLSSYLSSKTAQIKVMEYLAAENPHLFVCSVHPGMVETKIFNSAGASASTLPMDTVQLPAHFLVWLSQPKTKFLNGKFVWVNWDVDQLCEKAAEIEGSMTMTIGCEGWPFPHVGPVMGSLKRG